MKRSGSRVLYGADAIGRHVDLRRRQVYSLAEKNLLPVFKTGNVLCSTAELLDRWVAEQEVKAMQGRAA